MTEARICRITKTRVGCARRQYRCPPNFITSGAARIYRNLFFSFQPLPIFPHCKIRKKPRLETRAHRR